ncbi:transposase [Streptomyces sp. NPDC057543]|uniref:transposase n=1 Tax=Streptomyces sp. NPDC057543 TaxID=3346163 RepID=UPI0036B1EF52
MVPAGEAEISQGAQAGSAQLLDEVVAGVTPMAPDTRWPGASFHRIALIWAECGYTGFLVEHFLTTLALVSAIVKRSDDQKEFVVLPKRWIVERPFARLMQSHRLARDFERRTTSAEAVIYWSMILLMTRRLAHSRRGRA